MCLNIKRELKYTLQTTVIILFISRYDGPAYKTAVLGMQLLLLLILQSSDWLAALHLELLQAILFIAV